MVEKRFIRELTAEWINRKYYGNTIIRGYGQQQFIQRLLHESNRMAVYEDTQRLQAANRLIPPEILQLKDEKEFVMAMLKWFKQDFFQWVNELECPQCKIKCTFTTTTVEEEIRYGASRVELFKCPQCLSIYRFPRYNDPLKLLETRRGRCGEWANCFLLLLKSAPLKLQLRYILDLTDHVWVEYYSTTEKRWIHLDPCEQAYDSPLMYEVGWGKKLTFVFGFPCKSNNNNYLHHDDADGNRGGVVGVVAVVDVSKRYTRDYVGMVQRRVGLVDYRIVKEFLKQFESNGLLSEEDEKEEGKQVRLREVEEMEQRLDSVVKSSGLKKEEMLGRQSGSVEWRKARGEIGSSSKNGTSSEKEEEMERFRKSISQMKRMKFTSSLNEWMCNGIAKIQENDDKQLVLTLAKNDCVGSAFYSARKIDLTMSFRIGFSFRINGNGNGADGMALVLQQESLFVKGQGGSGLGYHGIKGEGGTAAGIAVEIDTYASVDRCNDPNSNHISVQQGNGVLSSHHDYSVAVCQDLPTLNNGSRYFVVVEYLRQKDEFNVYFSDDESKDYVRIIRIEKAQSKISLLHQKDCWFGFTAATGGLCQEHAVLDFCYEQF